MGKRNGNMLQHASEDLRGDPDIALEAVGHSGGALAFVHLGSETIKAEGPKWIRKLVSVAVEQSWVAVEFARGTDLSLEVRLVAVKQDWRAAEHIMQKDDAPPSEEELAAFADANPEVLQVGSLRALRTIVLAAVRRDGLALRYATRAWRSDREVVLEAM